MSYRMKLFDIKLVDVFEYNDNVINYDFLKKMKKYLNIYRSIQKLKEKQAMEEDFMIIIKGIKTYSKSSQFALKCIFEFLFTDSFKSKLKKHFLFLPIL